MEYFKSEEEFNKELKRFNTLFSKNFPWKNTKARKEHVDELGKKVKAGEIYFKRAYGGGYDEVLKLSKESMEQILFVLFLGNHQLSKIADSLIEQRSKELQEIFG